MHMRLEHKNHVFKINAFPPTTVYITYTEGPYIAESKNIPPSAWAPVSIL